MARICARRSAKKAAFKEDYDLTRLAFIYAEQNRWNEVLTYPLDSPRRKEILAEGEQLRSYRVSRWGLTDEEKQLSKANECEL